MARWRRNHYFLNDLRDLLESDPSLQKRSYRDFVGRVQGDGLRCHSPPLRKLNEDKEI